MQINLLNKPPLKIKSKLNIYIIKLEFEKMKLKEARITKINVTDEM